MTEYEIIEKISKKFEMNSSKKGFGAFGDDGFSLPSSGAQDSLVLSTDSFCEGTHFNSKMGFDSVGWKSLVAATSDIFAMGASPSFFSFDLMLPSDFKESDLDRVLEGMLKASHYYNIELLGGDVTKSQTLNISVQVGGYHPTSQLKSNRGAGKGDVLLTDQPLGRALLGFEILNSGVDIDAQSEAQAFLKAFQYPQPHPLLGAWLSTWSEVTTLTDISDGLYKELWSLSCDQKLQLELSELPISKEFKEVCEHFNLDAKKTYLQGGEDYALLWSLKTEALNDFLKSYQIKFKKRPFILGRVRNTNVELDSKKRMVFEDQSVVEGLKPFEHF